jgi:hypothetical protein
MMNNEQKNGAFYTLLGILGVLALCSLIFCIASLLFSYNNPFDAFQIVFRAK